MFFTPDKPVIPNRVTLNDPMTKKKLNITSQTRRASGPNDL